MTFLRTSKSAPHYLVMAKEALGDEWLPPTLVRFGASSLLDDLLRQVRWLLGCRLRGRAICRRIEVDDGCAVV